MEMMAIRLFVARVTEQGIVMRFARAPLGMIKVRVAPPDWYERPGAVSR